MLIFIIIVLVIIVLVQAWENVDKNIYMTRLEEENDKLISLCQNYKKYSQGQVWKE